MNNIFFCFCSIWFEHLEPWRIGIKGGVLQARFSRGAMITEDVLEAIVCLLQHKDEQMYRRLRKVVHSWRLILPPSFAVTSFSLFYLLPLTYS